MKEGAKELGAYIVMSEDTLSEYSTDSCLKDAEADALCCVSDSIRDNNFPPDVWYVLKIVKKTVLKKSVKLVDVVTLDDI